MIEHSISINVNENMDVIMNFIINRRRKMSSYRIIRSVSFLLRARIRWRSEESKWSSTLRN